MLKNIRGFFLVIFSRGGVALRGWNLMVDRCMDWC